jgi:hypothetical protein
VPAISLDELRQQRGEASAAVAEPVAAARELSACASVAVPPDWSMPQ